MTPIISLNSKVTRGDLDEAGLRSAGDTCARNTDQGACLQADSERRVGHISCSAAVHVTEGLDGAYVAHSLTQATERWAVDSGTGPVASGIILNAFLTGA